MSIIRQQVLDAIAVKLAAITTANGYTRTVGAGRVWEARKAPQQIPVPACLVLQGDEQVRNSVGTRYECTLPLSVGFVDAYGGLHPDAEAGEFLADIQQAMGQDLAVQVTDYATGALVVQTVQLYEEGNTLNASDALPGRIYGDIQFRVVYQRHVLDPRKL